MERFYNYGALAVAILNESLTVEKAISKISPLVVEQGENSGAELQDMLRLRDQGMTYRDIGRAFGLKADTVFHRLRRYKMRAG